MKKLDFEDFILKFIFYIDLTVFVIFYFVEFWV